MAAIVITGDASDGRAVKNKAAAITDKVKTGKKILSRIVDHKSFMKDSQDSRYPISNPTLCHDTGQLLRPNALHYKRLQLNMHTRAAISR